MAITSKPGYSRTLFMLVQMRARFFAASFAVHICYPFRFIAEHQQETNGWLLLLLPLVPHTAMLLQKFPLKSILFKRKHVQLVEFLFLIEYRQNKYAYDVVCFECFASE